MPAATLSRGRLAAAALSAAACMCCHYPLMAFYRKAFRAKYPELARAWTNDGPFAVVGPELPFLPEEGIYAARARTAATHGLPYDPFIRENRGLRMVSNDFLNYALLGLVQRATGDIQLTWSLARFACAFLWFVLLYLLAHELTRAPPLAFFFAAAVSVFSYLLTGMFVKVLPWLELWNPLVWPRALWILASYGRSESLLRLPRPGMTYALLFFAGILILRALRSRRPLDLALAGLAGGLLAYAHLDVWTTQVASLFVLGAEESFRRRRALHELWLPAAVSAAVSLPWLWLNYPPDPRLLEWAAELSRRPDAWSLVYLAAAAAAFRRALRSEPGPLDWLASFLAGLFLTLNIQLVTGYSVERNHWYWFGNIYAALFVLTALAERLRRLPDAVWHGAAAAALAICFAQNAVYAALHYPAFGTEQDAHEAARWLEEHAPPDSVVANADVFFAPLIPMLTPCKTLIAYANPVLSDAPLQEKFDRFVYALGLYGVPFESYLARKPEFFEAPGERDALMGRHMPAQKLRRMFADSAARAGELRFAVDYLWVGPAERALLDGAGRRLDGEPAFRNATIAIYDRRGGRT